MKKLFALMLALMLALAGVSAAFAEDAAAAPSADAVPAASSGAGTISLSLNLNGDMISQFLGAADQKTAGIAAAIVELLNNLSISMTSDGVDAEMVLTVKDEPVAGVAVLKDTDKMFILSDLFPHYYLKIDQNTAGSVMPQISMDPEQMTAMMAPATDLLNAMMAKVGAPEAVQETFYDTEFTAKNPINMTTKEALQMILGAAKDIVSQEGFTSLLDQLKSSGMSISFDPEEIDKKLEEINNAKDEDLPVLDASIYGNENSQDGLFVINMTKNEETVEVKTGSIGGGFVTEVVVPNKTHVFVKGQADGSMTMNIEFVPQEGLTVNILGGFKSSEAGFSGTFNVRLNDAELGTVAISGIPEPTMSGAFTMEGRTEITIEEMQNQSGEKMQAFQADFMAGLMSCLAKIVLAVPNLSDLMQQIMPMTGAPSGK